MREEEGGGGRSKQAKASKSQQKHYIPHSTYFGVDAVCLYKNAWINVRLVRRGLV